MANILMSDDMSLSESRPLELVFPDLGDIMGKHHADCFAYRDRPYSAGWPYRITVVMKSVTHMSSFPPALEKAP
jgi:hypothetical protein